MSNNRDFRSIVADSGPLYIEWGYEITVVDIPYIEDVTIPLPLFPDPEETQYRARLNGFKDDQWGWIQDTAEGQDHVFFFTHGRIVGGGEEQRGRLMFYTEDFVEWANQDDVNMEGVFVGHSHENHLFYNVSAVNIDNPPDLYDDITIGRNPIVYFSDINPNPDKGEINSPAYIESANST